MKKIILLFLTIIILFIIIISINNSNYNKEKFICVNKTTYNNKGCKSDLKQILNPIDYCSNNDKCNGYISVNIKDKFSNIRTVYFKCLDNWSGELYQKDFIYDKLKKKYKKYEFSNLKTYKCNRNCSPGKGIIDDSNTCLDCPDNKYNAGDSNKCKDLPNCPTNYILSNYDKKTGNISCIYDSSPGFYFDLNTLTKTSCPIGTYNNSYGNTTCTQASDGYYVDLIEQTTQKPYSITRCGPGKKFKPGDKTKDGECIDCEYNTYKTGTNSSQNCSSCSDCSGNQYRINCGGSNLGTCTNCGNCPAGKYRKNCSGTSPGNCEPCPPGKYKVGTNNQTYCSACPAGHSQPNHGQSKCNLCPYGYMQPHSGQANCIKCLWGYYSNNERTRCSSLY